MRFYCEDKTLDIEAGGVVFLPQGKAHAFTCTSSVVRTLIFVQATGKDTVALDRYFLAMGEPAASMVLPESALTYTRSMTRSTRFESVPLLASEFFHHRRPKWHFRNTPDLAQENDF